MKFRFWCVSKPTKFPSPFDVFLSDLSSHGVHPSEHGCTYLVIPARSDFRWWLIPLSFGGVCAQAGLAMFQPTSWLAAIWKIGWKFLVRFAPNKLMRTYTINLSGSPDFLELFGDGNLVCAYFTGTSGPHRKTTAQIMHLNGKVLGYVKFGGALQVKKYIANEALTLTYLKELDIRKADFPNLLDHRQTGGTWLLATDSFKSQHFRSPKTLETAHREFLLELAAKTRKFGATTVMSRLDSQLENIGSLLSPEWILRVEASRNYLAPFIETLPVAFSHGDFTPWNSFIQGDRLYVFDWEYSEPLWPLGYDVAHFLLSTDLKGEPSQRLAMVIEEITDLYEIGDHVQTFQLLLLSLLAHAFFYLERSVLENHDSEVISWSAGDSRATLIDLMLSSL